ncbi:MAG TPA: hypothetical protein VEH76_12145 [Methylocystis sp.]|nr:hypothetical protein [Methylocystis sp.]
MSAADARWQLRMSGAVAMLWVAALGLWVVFCAFDPFEWNAERHDPRLGAAQKLLLRH